MVKYSFEDIKKIALKPQNNLWNVFFAEFFAIPMIWFIANFLPFITPNIATTIGLIFWLASVWVMFLAFSSPVLFIVAALLYELGLIFDIADGRLSKLKKINTGGIGRLYDNLSGYIKTILLCIVVGIGLFNLTQRIIYVIIPLVYAWLDMFLSLWYMLSYKANKDKVLVSVMKEKNEKKPVEASLFFRVQKVFLRFRLRMGFTNVETEAVVFFICPIIVFFTGNVLLFYWAFLLAILMRLVMFVVFAFLQFKLLFKNLKELRANEIN